MDFRKDRVTGAGEFAEQEKTKTTFFIREKEADYSDKYVTTSFIEIFKNLRLKNQDAPRDMPRTELVKLVRGCALLPSAR